MATLKGQAIKLKSKNFFLNNKGFFQNISRSSILNNQIINEKQKATFEDYKGTGGRSSISGKVVTIFGASGTIGRILVNRLGKEGSNVVIAYRGDIHDLRGLKLCGDLGNIHFQEIDIRNAEKIRKAVQYSNIVINCIGANYETRNFSYNDVNVEAARLIAKMCRESKVEKLIHFSSLNASLNPPKIYVEPSKFLISKFLGEISVKDEYNEAVIIRPSNIYGENDKFLFYYANELRRGLTSIPLWKRGEMTIKMPVHQSDVCDGIMKIVHNKDIKGITYDFVGPKSYLLSEIVDYIFQKLQRNNIRRILMTPTRLGFTYLTEKLTKKSIFTLDMIEREFISDSLSNDYKNPTLKDLINEFKDFEQMVTWHLKAFNKLSYYNEKLGEFSQPKAPKPLSGDFEFQLRRKIKQAI